jgi:ClpP class serine protease
VDELGGLDQAIDSAAKRAKLEKGYRVLYVEKEKPLRERIMAMLAAETLELATAAGWVTEASPAAAGLSVAARLGELQADLAQLARWNDPHGVYAHCLCASE